VIAVIVVIAVSAGGGSGSSTEVMPADVGGGAPDVLPAALTVANTTGISGVVAYDITGYPASSSNGPASRALGHAHVTGPVTYSVTPPAGGDHNAEWMNCGVYDKAVSAERAVHNLEHGAVWITYQPSLPQAEARRRVRRRRAAGRRGRGRVRDPRGDLGGRRSHRRVRPGRRRAHVRDPA